MKNTPFQNDGNSLSPPPSAVFRSARGKRERKGEEKSGKIDKQGKWKGGEEIFLGI